MSCEICDKPAKHEYMSWTSSYYRNKSYSHTFCSDECLKKFNKNHKCYFCSYHSDLESTNDGFMVCTSKEYWKYSCQEKYEIMHLHGLNYDTRLDDNDMDLIINKEYLPEHLRSDSTDPIIRRIERLESKVADMNDSINTIIEKIELLN